MTTSNLMTIDPGSSSGAIAFGEGPGSYMSSVHNMPDSMEGIWAYFDDSDTARCVCVLEDVGGSMPGNAAKAARTFAEHVGALKMALIAKGITVVKVRPAIWMKELFPQGYPQAAKGSSVKEKADAKKARKQFIYDEMKKKYPDISFTLRQADAVALLAWGTLKGVANV